MVIYPFALLHQGTEHPQLQLRGFLHSVGLDNNATLAKSGVHHEDVASINYPAIIRPDSYTSRDEFNRSSVSRVERRRAAFNPLAYP